MDISTEDYKRALSADGILRTRDLEMLRAHHGCQNCSATAGQLVTLLGYADVIQVNGAFGRLGHRISDYLQITPLTRSNGSFPWWAVLAYGAQEDQGFAWTLRDELVQALGELGLLEIATDSYAEEIHGYRNLFEGAKRQITVNAYERNPTARALCVQHYGTRCVVCDFEFFHAYGEVGRDFIHVHHLIELSEIGSEYRVDPIADLRPVCPNCHAMLHRQRPAISIDDLRALVKKDSV